MDALKIAIGLLAQFEKANDGKTFTAEQAMEAIKTYAAIAQAEQLQRIADVLNAIYELQNSPYR